MKEKYETELKRIFKSLSVNYPHIYKSVDFSDLAADWYRFFSKRKVPPEVLFECYENVLEYKAEQNNDFGTVSCLDLLSAHTRIKNKTLGTDKKIKCELCDGNGYITAFNLNKKKEELKKCPNLH